MKETIRLINYWIYNVVLSLFIIIVSAFMIFDIVNNGDTGHVLKYAICFIVFGAFLAGSAFFNQKLVNNEFHPASLLFVVAGLVYIFIGTINLTGFLGETPETMIDLNFPLWLSFIAGATFILLIRNNDEFFSSSKVVNAVILVGGIATWFFLEDTLKIVCPICFIVSAIVGDIRAIPAFEFEQDHDLLMPW